jgi:hypothetical protein
VCVFPVHFSTLFALSVKIERKRDKVKSAREPEKVLTLPSFP